MRQGQILAPRIAETLQVHADHLHGRAGLVSEIFSVFHWILKLGARQVISKDAQNAAAVSGKTQQTQPQVLTWRIGPVLMAVEKIVASRLIPTITLVVSQKRFHL